MAVLVEAISVIVRVDSINKKFPGGWIGFKDHVPNQTLCADNELARVGFMTSEDVKNFVVLVWFIAMAEKQKIWLLSTNSVAPSFLAIGSNSASLGMRNEWRRAVS